MKATSSVVIVVNDIGAAAFPLAVQPFALVDAVIVGIAVLRVAIVLINGTPIFEIVKPSTLFVFLIQER